MGIGQLVSGLTVRQGAPWAVVGEAAINLAPPPVKNFAISAFGSNDKNVLVAGILIVLAIFAAVVGVLALRRLAYGYLGLAIFAAVGVAAAISLPKANLGWAAPTVFGALVAAFFLTKLTQRALDATATPIAIPPPAAAERAGEPVPDTEADPEADPAGTSAGADPEADHAGTSGGTVSPASASAWTRSSPKDPAGEADDSWTPREPAPAGPSPETWTYRPPDRTGRRRFLVASGLAVGTTAVAAFAGRELNARQSVTQARSSVRLPKATDPTPPLPAGVDLKIPNLSPFVTSNTSFYRVDTAIVLPQVDPANWQLRIHGMVEREITISFAQLLRRPLIEHYVTLTCVSDPVEGPYISNAKWLGASLADLIRSARPRAGATQLLCTSVDGFTSGTPIEVVLDGREALLAVAMNGTALPVAHGFPARMVVPGLYGYVSATKWVTDIKVTTYQAEVSYWAQRGWSAQAPIKTESRIDVPLGGASVKRGRTAIAGVAWAQHRGIDAVEVRVDNGPWHQATLAAVPGVDTWRQWAYYWDAPPGNHVIEARATDKTGYTQTANQAPPEPNGASGYPSIQVTVKSS
ncbi:MAG TPA: molybdopterin-dependent oxidoreductase [Streptosporangiaceae bacterium]|jgi:DMSO/TMAO reductase YedYZ molybdopterin-dependent catalytic subunit